MEAGRTVGLGAQHVVAMFGATFTGIALGSIAALVVYHGVRLLGLRLSTETSDAVCPEPERR